MNKTFLILVTFTGLYFSGKAQVGIGTTTPHASSALDVSSSDKGVLFPRLTETQRSAISAPATGLLVYQTDGSSGYYYFTGTTWTSLVAQHTSGNYVGDYKLSAQTADHDKWLVCDGRAISRSTYANLFALIGTNFGAGNGSTTFTLPDFRGRVAGATGLGSGLTNRTIGTGIGTETHILTIAQMPSHSHSVYDPGHNHISRIAKDDGNNGNNNGQAPSGDATANAKDGYATSGSTTGISLYNAGGGAAHNIMQPTLFAGSYFIYAGN